MTKTQMKPETYVSVDIEGSHAENGDWDHIIREIGACIVGNTQKQFFIQFAYDGADQTKPFVTPEQGMLLFEAWLSQFSYPIFVSFNSWDYVHVFYYFWKYLGRSPFGLPGRSIDMKVYFMGKYGVLYQDTHKHAVKKLCPTNLPHTHNGLEDSMEQAEIFEQMLMRHDSPQEL